MVNRHVGSAASALTNQLLYFIDAKLGPFHQGTTAPTPSPPESGLSVVLGRDYALRWVGQS